MTRVLVTGATGAIGAAAARLLAERGEQVLAAGRDLSKAPAGTRGVQLDLERPESLAAGLAAAGISPDEPLDALVHSAGVCELGPVGELSAESWARHLAVNLAGPAELTRLLLPGLRAAGGRIVFVNSGAGLSASPNWSAYAASKFGLRALADSLRAEEAAAGVRVTTVYPGRTDSEMQRAVRGWEGGDYRPDDFIRPESVAALILTALDVPDDAQLPELQIRPFR